MAGQPQQGNLPLGQYAISKEDRKAIRELGRKLDVWLMQEAKGRDIPTRIVFGAFDYVNSMIEARIRMMSDYYLRLRETVSQKGLEQLLLENEPFADIEKDIRGAASAGGTPPPPGQVRGAGSPAPAEPVAPAAPDAPDEEAMPEDSQPAGTPSADPLAPENKQA